MAWRFRKSVKIFPGVRINLGKRGISTTIGVRGASVNISARGTYLNTGLPGTGLSNRVRLDAAQPNRERANFDESYELPTLLPDVPFDAHEVGAIESIETELITSDGLQSLKQMLIDAYEEKRAIEALLVT